MSDAASDSGPGRDAPGPLWLRVLLPLGIAGVAFVVFLPALGNGFVNWDDDKLLLESSQWRGLGRPQLTWMFTSGRLGHYHPLTWLTYAIDLRLWRGLDPRGFHLTSMVFHAVNAVLVYVLALRLLRMTMTARGGGQFPCRLGAALTGLLFAVHPLRVESVAWVTERRDVLSTFFLVPCLLCYLRYATARRLAGRWYAASLTLLLLSLMSKAWGITLPAVLLVLDFYPLRRLGWGWSKLGSARARAAYLDKIPFALLAGWAAFVAARAQSFGEVMKPLEAYGFPQRIAQAFYGLAFYVWKTVIPAGLAPIYEIPADMNPLAGRFLVAAVSVLIVTALLVAVRRRWPAGLALWVAYCIILSPVLGLTQSGPQLVADRYSYIACMTWAVLAGAGLAWCWVPRDSGRLVRGRSVLASGAAVAVVGVLATLTWRQTLVWRTSQSLWEHTLRVDPDSWNANNNLGTLCLKRGKPEQALKHYRAALAVKDDLAAAWSNIGVILARQGDMAGAVEHMRRARSLASDDAPVLKQVAGVLLQAGRTGEALETYRELVRFAPGDPVVHLGMAAALRRLEKVEEAVTHWEEAVELIEEASPGGPAAIAGGPYAAHYKKACTDLANFHGGRGNHRRANRYADKLRAAGRRGPAG